jgi:hypothetical protein
MWFGRLGLEVYGIIRSGTFGWGGEWYGRSVLMAFYGIRKESFGGVRQARYEGAGGMRLVELGFGR